MNMLRTSTAEIVMGHLEIKGIEMQNGVINDHGNHKKDFKRFHDLEVNEIDGVAIMSDTDNSKMMSIAYFQNIYFSSK